MRLLRSFPLLVHALVLLGIVGFCVASPSVNLLLVAGALAAMSWYVTEGPRGRSLPRWASNVLTIAVSINLIVDFAQHYDDPVGVLGRFTTWLTLIKLYERKTTRDYAQLLALSILLIMTGVLQSADMLFGLVLLLYVVLGLYVLVLYQLYASYERMKSERTAAIPEGYRLAPPLRPIIGRKVGLQFRSLVAGIGLAGLGLSVLVFIVTPRTVGGVAHWSGRHVNRDRTSGFSTEVNLTSGVEIRTSRSEVAHLELLDGQNRATRYYRPFVHLRGAVMHSYQGDGRWTGGGRSSGDRVTTDGAAFARLGEAPSHTLGGLAYTQRFTSLSRRESTVFSIATPIAIATERRGADFHYHYESDTITYHGGGWLRSYMVRAQPNVDDLTLEALHRGHEPQPARFSPYRNDEVQRIAERLLRNADLPTAPPEDEQARWEWRRDAAHLFTSFLQSPRFTYDTDLSDVRVSDPDELARDPVERFLNVTRRGHCEYFASALTALCHTVEIPARIVTGYLATEYDESSGYYVIRESNAHAWAEVRTGPHRWTMFDPSPPSTLHRIHRPEPSLADRLQSLYDRFELGWNSGFVGFDRRSQAQLAETVNGGWTQRLTGFVENVLEWMAAVNRAFDLGPVGYMWLGLVAFAILLAGIVLVKVIRRVLVIRSALHLRGLRRAETQQMLRQLGFYVDMLLVLRKAGHAKPAWQPPRDFAEALSGRSPAAGAIVRALTDRLYAVRYGLQPLTSDQLAEAKRLLARLPAAMRG